MQRDRPFDFIRLLRLDSITLEWNRNRNGYYLHSNATAFGFVRFNIGNTQGTDGMFSIYVREPFEDPQGLFENDHASGQPFAWLCIVEPADSEELERVVEVLRTAASAQ